MHMASAFVSTSPRHGLLCAAGSWIQGVRLQSVSTVQVPASAGSWRPGLAWAASKQKKKGKERRRAGGAGGARGRGPGWNFDALMLVWDEVFDRCCEDAERATAIRALGKKGLARFGSGCVLVQETVRTLPRGSASGFSSHARQRGKGKGLDEPPAYETLKWTAEYVPRTFVLNPSLAPEPAGVAGDSNQESVLDVTNQAEAAGVTDDPNQASALDVINQGNADIFYASLAPEAAGVTDDPNQASALDVTNQMNAIVFDPSLAPEDAGGADDPHQASALDVTDQVIEDVPLVTRDVLFPVLRGMDRTRIMGLTGDEISSVANENGPTEPQAPDAGGEEPYNPRNEELVLMLVVTVDGQPAVGADVVKALPAIADAGDEQQLWKLEMRDFHTLPI